MKGTITTNIVCPACGYHSVGTPDECRICGQVFDYPEMPSPPTYDRAEPIRVVFHDNAGEIQDWNVYAIESHEDGTISFRDNFTDNPANNYDENVPLTPYRIPIGNLLHVGDPRKWEAYHERDI